MAREVKLKKKLGGLNKLMTSPPVQAEVNRRAAKIAAAAGPKYRMVIQGKKRSKRVARAYVQPAKGVATNDDDERRLLGALDAAKD